MTEVNTQERGLPPSVVIGFVTNAAGLAAGAVFFTADPGSRFRGMEPEAMIFLSVGCLAAALGNFVGLSASIYDCSLKRWFCGLFGWVLAFTPIFVAALVSELAALMLCLNWN